MKFPLISIAGGLSLAERETREVRFSTKSDPAAAAPGGRPCAAPEGSPLIQCAFPSPTTNRRRPERAHPCASHS